MKKLLSILAAIGLTATASTSVVACSSGSGSDSSDKGTPNFTKTDGSLTGITASSTLSDWLNKEMYPSVFGDQGTATKTFMNYFAEAFMNYIAKASDADLDKLKKSDFGKLYVDDGMFDAIKKDWKNRNSNADEAWQTAIDNAKANYGKKWESKFQDDLKNQFGPDVYINGSSKTATSYSDYKSTYESNAILNGSSTGSSDTIFESLKNDIYAWGKTPTGSDPTTILNNIRSSVFSASSITINGKNIGADFNKNNKAGKDAATTNRDQSWFGQMDKLLKALQDAKADSKSPKDVKTYLDLIVDMYNVTGGLNANTDTQINGTTKDTSDTFNVADVQWANEDNVMKHITDIKSASNELIQRLDTNYDLDFGENATSQTSDAKNMMINPLYNYFNDNKLTTVFSNNQTDQMGSQINGLFSNSQRFVANDYYNIEKPVAVSEIVISPIQSNTSDWSQEINNVGFAGNDIKMTDQLYRFLGNYIDNSIPKAGDLDFTKANVDKPNESGEYSWDSLMSGQWDKDVSSSTNEDWNSTFEGKVKVQSHDNLLTIDSSSSDYSDLLKNSVYDYLSNGAAGNAYKQGTTFDSATDPTADIPGQVTLGSINNANPTPSIDSSVIKTEYDTVTNFINSLNRADASKKAGNGKMYSVVNPTQGIISFADKDGIHFVRIEGYGVGTTDSESPTNIAKADIVGDQTKLTTADFSSNDAAKTGNTKLTVGDQEKASYNAALTLSSELTGTSLDDAGKKQVVQLTSDYADANKGAQNTAGFKYSNLNTGFGNKYLQFLANSSIPKSLGYSSPKYKYDLNSLLKTYIGGDITSDNIVKGSSMLMMVWNYAKGLLGKTDENADSEMYDWVLNGGSDKATNAIAKSPLKNTIFGNANAIGADKDLAEKFKDGYKKYITTWILSKYSDSSRLTNSQLAFQNGMSSYDDNVTNKTTWTDPNVAKKGYNPSLTWDKALSGSSSGPATFADDNSSSSSYFTEMTKLYDSNIWKPFKETPSTPGKATAYTYDVEMDEFIPNDYALKGDEE